jgi:hypothetical protein
MILSFILKNKDLIKNKILTTINNNNNIEEDKTSEDISSTPFI